MSRAANVVREFRGYNLLEAGRRLFDDKPLQCSLYVTDQCNLDCAYCSEYDNSRPHPKLADLRAWIDKIRDLGTMRIALVGGEPLMHPEIVQVVEHCRAQGLATSLTTNGFLLTPELIGQLERAGLQVMQISVDRMTPSPITRKSFKTLLPKLAALRESSIRVHITGVICGDTLAQSRQVLQEGLRQGFPTEIRLVHADPTMRYRVDRGEREELEQLLEWMLEEKARGTGIHTNDAILRYQLSLVRDEPVEWTCAAGYKIFFVSAQGKFWLCSMRPTDQDILDVTADDLRANNCAKPCQPGCGVYCAVSTSMVVDQPARIIGREVLSRARRAVRTAVRATADPTTAVSPG